MSAHHQSICLIAGGLTGRNLPLQPWRYLHEVARQLIAQGHAVTALSDGAPDLPAEDALDGVPIVRLASLSSPRWRANRPLEAALGRLNPQVTLWHVGLTSFLHQRVPAGLPGAHIGIFTSPLYQRHEIARLGVRRVASGYKLSGVHVVGTFAPRPLLRASLRGSGLRRLVVQSRATEQRLRGYGLDAERVQVIAPGVDPAWRPLAHGLSLRAELGYTANDTVVMYFGSPARLRGLHTLVRAIEIARRDDPSLKLLVLSRRRADELLREDNELFRLMQATTMRPHVNVVSGFLDEATLVRHVAACDIVSLPFELIPSDAPLSLLEAQALGKPVVTSDLGCLAELVERGPSYLAQPADPHSLARALAQAAADLRGRAPQTGIAFEPRSWQQVGAEWSRLVQSL